MKLPDRPEDREKKRAGLLAGERGRGFAEIMPDSQAYLVKLKTLIPSRRKPHRKQRRKK